MQRVFSRRSYRLQRTFASQAGASAAEQHPYYDVPAGHKNSDLRNEACHIGLNRRRDLTLRSDVKLYDLEKQQTVGLVDVLKGKLTVLFGVPDMGEVCAQKHVPSYLAKLNELTNKGVNSIICLAVASPEELEQFCGKLKMQDTMVKMYGDPKAHFTRMLGLERGPPGAPGARSHRYAALVDDGILLKLMVEDSLADVNKTSADTMVDTVQLLKGHNPIKLVQKV